MGSAARFTTQKSDLPEDLAASGLLCLGKRPQPLFLPFQDPCLNLPHLLPTPVSVWFSVSWSLGR